jgi:uncharacterized membrane protein YedE/YeeE
MKHLASSIAALVLGFIFGLGLIVSGMVDPANVKRFLDVTGQTYGAWRPQLLAVLGAGMMVTTMIYLVAKRRKHPLVEAGFHWPHATAIDRQLTVGSALFGAGWALAGYCPGPALVAVGSFSSNALIFVVAMAAGGFLQHILQHKLAAH